MGGKNSIFHKPLGTGKKSVSHNPLNVMPAYSGGIGKYQTGMGIGDIAGRVFGGTTENQSNPYGSFEANKKQAMQAMDYGRKQGEVMTGGTMADAGKGRKQVRDRLEQVFQGNSAGANRLAESQNADARQLKARQAMYGGGQMSEGQRQAQERNQARDMASFVSDEKRQAVADLSREYRGMAGDIMKSSGQYGSIIMGAQPPAQPAQQSQGLLSRVFGGLF